VFVLCGYLPFPMLLNIITGIVVSGIASIIVLKKELQLLVKI
jgi:hypothetical protein